MGLLVKSSNSFDESCINVMFLRSYLQSNGYKPMPLDLTAVPLSEKMKELVEQLAENTHRLWSSERIKLGWTYGLHDVRFSPAYTCIISHGYIAQIYCCLKKYVKLTSCYMFNKINISFLSYFFSSKIKKKQYCYLRVLSIFLPCLKY